MLCIDIHENKLSSAISAPGMKERILALKYLLKYPRIQLGAELRPSSSNDFIAQLALTSRYCTSHKYANPNNYSHDEAMTLVTLPSLHQQISCNKLKLCPCSQKYVTSLCWHSQNGSLFLQNEATLQREQTVTEFLTDVEPRNVSHHFWNYWSFAIIAFLT
jgi:hypothetical protein